MRPLIQINPGDPFGKWTVLYEAQKRYGNKRYAMCRCECGNEREVGVGDLSTGHSKSCHCLEARRAKNMAAFGTTTVYGLPERKIWRSMIWRCESPKYTQFRDYGGRGITVCERWRNSFEDFMADMGRMPGPEYSIERKDVNGNYEPSNCIWIPRFDQAANTRRTHHVSVDGKQTHLSDAVRLMAPVLGLTPASLCSRVMRGMSPERAFSLPRRLKGDRATSQFNGVSWCKRSQSWRARIFLSNTMREVGAFKDEYDAALAYNFTLALAGREDDPRMNRAQDQSPSQVMIFPLSE